MFNKTQTVGGMTFNGGSPLLSTAVGLGYLKQPLRYLTSEDIKTMGMRTMQIPRPNTTYGSETPNKKVGASNASVFSKNKMY